MWGRGNSNLPPLCLRTKLDDPPLLDSIFTDFAPTLHRLWYGGTREEHGRKNRPKA